MEHKTNDEEIMDEEVISNESDVSSGAEDGNKEVDTEISDAQEIVKEDQMAKESNEAMEVEDGGKEGEKPKSKVRETVVLSGFSLSRALWKDEDETTKWITMQGQHVDEITTSILAMMDREVPTNFVALVYQSFVGVEDIVTLEDHFSRITQKQLNSEIHKLVIPTIFSSPVNERIWPEINALNQHIRILCIDMGRPVLNMHKAILISNNNGKIQYIRPEMWKEFQTRTGVGSSLSFEGLSMVKSYLKKYLDGGGFEEINRPASKVVAPDMIPPPLCYTNGYKGDEKMIEFIKEAGLRTPAKPKGNQRQAGPSKAATKNKNTHTPEPPKEKRPREARAARRLDLSSDDDATEEERRARRYLEAKKKLGKKRGEDTEALTKELNNMRIEGIKASKRSKEKYERFEDKIKDLEAKIIEKERKLKKLNENEKRMQRLEDKLDEKYEVIKKLRNDLAEADVEIDEWKEAYEEEKEARDDEREAYDELHQKFNGLKRKRRGERDSS